MICQALFLGRGRGAFRPIAQASEDTVPFSAALFTPYPCGARVMSEKPHRRHSRDRPSDPEQIHPVRVPFSPIVD